MNTPGVATGNWTWRLNWERVGPEPADQLARISEASGRA